MIHLLLNFLYNTTIFNSSGVFLLLPLFPAKNLDSSEYLQPKKVEIILSSKIASHHISGKLTTYPSPKPTFCPKRDVSVNVDLGEG